MDRLINKVIIPVILLLLMVAYPLHAYASTQPYTEGFNMGLAHGQNNCQYGRASSSSQDACIQGFIAGLHKAASITLPYHVGYNQGVKDHLDGVLQKFCRSFQNDTSPFSAQWDCQEGYQAGYAYASNLRPTIEQTEAYKIRYLGGSNNSSLGYHVCADFTGRDVQICTTAFDEGYNTLPWSETHIFNLGYKYGYAAAKEKNPSPDRARDCSFTVVNIRKTDVCEGGWDKGFADGVGVFNLPPPH
jgi:hypothetical protein